MRYILIIGIMAASILLSKVSAQDAHFSQFYSNPIYLAPSFAGSSHSTRFVGAFRDQWPKIPGNFINYSFSADHYVPKIKSGFAFLASSDNAGGGKLVTSNISFGYSYNVRLTRKLFLQPGLAAYYYSRKIDHTQISFSDEYFMNQYVGSTSENLSFDKVQHADFAVSSLLYTYNMWLGFNVDHLMSLSPVLRSDIRYSDMRLSVFGGYKFKIKHRTRNKYNEYIHAAFNYRMQSSIHQMDIGAYYNRQPYMIGLWYRGIPLVNEYATSSAIVYLFGFKYDDYIFSYSFDMSLGNLISQTGGSHEITVTYFITKAGRPKKFKAIPCPEM